MNEPTPTTDPDLDDMENPRTAARDAALEAKWDEERERRAMRFPDDDEKWTL